MAEITMPRLSDTMEEGTIASWLKKPGEQVNKGDVIAQIETDKATMDLTAFEAGTLQEILAPEGTTVAIGKPVARIGSGPGKSTSAPADQGSAPPAEGATPATEAAAQPAAAPAPAPAAEGADDERVSLSQMRRTIARRMAESTRTVPHFFLTTTVDATEMASLRKQINAQTADDGIKITFNDMVVKGVAVAIRKVPEVNVSFAEDSVIRHKRVHIGVAVATDRGLIVPVIRDVDQKGIGQVARETRDLAERANSGKLQPPDYTGGTFTVSNLGMF